jgi:hypothetical protein
MTPAGNAEHRTRTALVAAKLAADRFVQDDSHAVVRDQLW